VRRNAIEKMERVMKRLIVASVAVAIVYFSSEAATSGERLRLADRANAALWEGASLVFQFAADQQSPVRGNLVGDFNEEVKEFEVHMAGLKQGPHSEAQTAALQDLEQNWSRFKTVGADIIGESNRGAMSESRQLSRLREIADRVNEDLSMVADHFGQPEG
jgi:hypothetical protein